MYNNKFPIELIKKKVYEHTIAYKFKWNNGTISIELMNQLTPQMLELVHQYEFQLYNLTKKKVKLNQPQVSSQSFSNLLPKSQTDFIQTSQLKEQETPRIANTVLVKTSQESIHQSNTVLPQDIISQTEQSNPKQYLKKTFTKHSHQPKPNKDCIIKNIRKDNGDIFLQITDDNQTKWVKLEDLKKDSPITLCDYLLSKVKIK